MNESVLNEMKAEVEKAKKQLKQDEEKMEDEMINQEEMISKAERDVKLLKLKVKEK